jgi:hypothetical protein
VNAYAIRQGNVRSETMTKPNGIKTRIFLDGGNPNETWEDYDIRHDLSDKGMEQFSKDWNGLIR